METGFQVAVFYSNAAAMSVEVMTSNKIVVGDSVGTLYILGTRLNGTCSRRCNAYRDSTN
jgi:hypothetical protein